MHLSFAFKLQCLVSSWHLVYTEDKVGKAASQLNSGGTGGPRAVWGQVGGVLLNWHCSGPVPAALAVVGRRRAQRCSGWVCGRACVGGTRIYAVEAFL